MCPFIYAYLILNVPQGVYNTVTLITGLSGQNYLSRQYPLSGWLRRGQVSEKTKIGVKDQTDKTRKVFEEFGEEV
jgi:hypothetical protein